jgi:hypothetical protein
MGPQTLLESFYFQTLGSLENLSQILVLRNSLKFTFLPSQIFYNFLGIFWIFPNYFSHLNFLIHFPKNRNHFLWISFSFPAQPAHPLLRPWPAGRPKLPSPPSHHPGSPGFIALSAQVAHDLISYLRPKQGAATAAARLVPLLCPSVHGQPSPSCVRRVPLLHHPRRYFPFNLRIKPSH